MDLVQPHPKPPPPAPHKCGLCFFTVPIIAYIMKAGENMNCGLSKSIKKTGTLDFSGNPSQAPPLWI